MLYTPGQHQDEIILHQIEVPRGGTWAGMGTGKTSATLTALQLVQEFTDPRPALVLAPKRVASYTWPREIKKWNHLTGDVRPVLGSASDRMALLRGGLRSGNFNVFSMNYDNVPWLVETLSDLKIKWPFGTIIADEVTRLKSFRLKQGGKRAAALNKIAWEYCDRFWGLTGTPAPNGLKDLWGQTYFYDAGSRLGRSYTDYMERWFYLDRNGHTVHPHEHSQAQIEAALADICLSVDVPCEKPIVNKVYVELPADIRARYREMERAAYTEIKEKGYEAIHAAAKTGKLMQMANGAIYDADKNWVQLHTAKLEALESIVEEAAGMPVLVATCFKFDKTMILRAFPQARVIDSDRDIDDWNGGKIGIGLAHPGSMGHGIDMQHGGNIIARFGGDWNLEFYRQIMERLGPMRQKQSGYARPVYDHHIMVENSIDEEVYERRVEKITLEDALKHGLKRIGL